LNRGFGYLLVGSVSASAVAASPLAAEGGIIEAPAIVAPVPTTSRREWVDWVLPAICVSTRLSKTNPRPLRTFLFARQASGTAEIALATQGHSAARMRRNAPVRNSPRALVLPSSPQHPLPVQQETFMSEKDLSALFLDTLKDIYYAEKQIYKSLPKLAKAASSDELRAAFEKHHDETEGHIERLEKIFELIGKPARGKKCDAIEGILDEGQEIMQEYKGAPALDAGLLAAAQAVEHYEISRYGTLKTWAERLGIKDAVKLLDQTLTEEKKTDDALSKIAISTVNAEAA
jgi:ferritin-like metal-binding protein YciE